MKKRIKLFAVYGAALMLCIWSCADMAYRYSRSEYSETMEMLTYQLDYSSTYSPVYSSFTREILRTAADDITEENMEKTVYLTFDDGPTTRTGEILDILKKHGVRATFFVICAKEEYIPFMQRAVEEGHTVGVHSASHKYKEIYSSVDSYLQDFTQCYDYIYNATGYEPTIYRFPGGSVNNHNAQTRKEISREMARRGFIYFDWNVESGDSGDISSSQIYRNVVDGCKGKQKAVVIMHDSIGKKSTVAALEEIIVKLKEDGWDFMPLTNEVRPVIFRMK